jgi:hypothetical protein
MEFPGLPAVKTVEQAILLAQLRIMRQMEKADHQNGPVLAQPPRSFREAS